LFPNVIVSLFFKPEYARAADLFPILGFFSIMFSCILVFSQYVQAIHRDRFFLVTALAGAATSITVGSMIIPQYGALGATWTLFAGHGTTAVLFGGLLFYVLCVKTDPIDQ